MSAVDYYLSKGYLPINKSVLIAESAAVSVWTPSTSTRITVTNLTIANNPAGTVAFYWGNVGGSKIAEFSLSASASVTPEIGIWQGTAFDRSLFARVSAGVSDGTRINLTGFEIPMGIPGTPP